MASKAISMEIEGRTLRMTNLDKVLYPETGFTKGDLVEYFRAVAPVMLPHLRGRPLTLKRFPDGVEGQFFFEKQCPSHRPPWVRTIPVLSGSRSRVIEYCSADDLPTLLWLGNLAAVELHPLLSRHEDGSVKEAEASFVVFDLDPGAPAAMRECLEVAMLIRGLLDGVGLSCYPKTSGSKGLQVYVPLNSATSFAETKAFARSVAALLHKEHPGKVVDKMDRSLRAGKVLVDWSQNDKAKTTVAAYSTRAKPIPSVSTPITWEEAAAALEAADNATLDFGPEEVLARVASHGDLFAPVLSQVQRLPGTTPGPEADPAGSEAAPRLGEYLSKRDFSATPEPAGARSGEGNGRGTGAAFVIQEHHARRLHWDLRLEHEGVGVSWALPKGLPTDPARNHLAVPTEDHPLEYFSFAGHIPEGHYGAGEVSIWDSGAYDCEAWEETKVKVRLHGERARGHFALFKVGERRWLIHKMADEDAPVPVPDSLGSAGGIVPMAATASPSLPPDEERWAYEVKWDGFRIIAFVSPSGIRLQSRALADVTSDYPQLRGLSDALGGHSAVLDGELCALDENGRADFSLLQMRGTKPARIVYVIFDLLSLDGTDLTREPYSTRRRRLESLGLEGSAWMVPAYHVGDGEALLEATRAAGVEGLVAKELSSPYLPGKRSRSWLKIKNRGRQEFVIGGWMPSTKGRPGRLGSLLVGYYSDGALRYAGRVGTGFTDEEKARLESLLAPLERDSSPFSAPPPLPSSLAAARFAEPELVAEVEFAEWTRTPLLRSPSYKGLRPDKAATDVVREA